MASEESPLLGTPNAELAAELQHEAVYARFSNAQKRAIVTMVSFAGLIPLFVSGTFIPSIPQIAKDLHSTGSVVSLAVSISILTNAIGTLLWATYSGFYGRRPVYLCSLACAAVGSIGVASARDVPELLAFRVLQAFGTSSGLSVGMAVIGDIYKLEERGKASGIFFGAVLLGPALAPPAGGFAAHYYSWRIMQVILGICGAVMWLVTFLLLPETTHPGTRGVDKLIESEGKAKWVWLNPFRSLWLFQSPNITLTALAGAFSLLTDYALLVPLAYTIGLKYGIDNEAIIGAFFIPSGIGNLIGALTAGRLSDSVIVKWREKRGGEWVPEDRLRATLLGAGIFTPLSTIVFGFVTQWVHGWPGIVMDLVCLFVNGLGIDFTLTPIAAYNVDIMHSRSAEVTAINMAFRGTILSLCIPGLLPSIDAIGIAATNSIIAVISVIGFIFILAVIRYGGRMRAWNDVGYSTILDT
ncbi:MFS general substrate transporter [Panus rudis PR-1116 ss-1]|nr:MFS general substrate transporter [Panus rudis PR-1116 ss-1]